MDRQSVLRPQDRARLEAIVEADDSSITPRDRIAALQMLQDYGGRGISAANVRITTEVESLTGAQLDEALRDYFEPGYLAARLEEHPPPKLHHIVPLDEQAEHEIERRAHTLAREMWEEWVGQGLKDVERHAQESHGAEPAEGSTTPTPEDSDPQRSAQRSGQAGEGSPRLTDEERERMIAQRRQAPPGIDPEVHKATNDLGYRRKIRRHMPPW